MHIACLGGWPLPSVLYVLRQFIVCSNRAHRNTGGSIRFIKVAPGSTFPAEKHFAVVCHFTLVIISSTFHWSNLGASWKTGLCISGSDFLDALAYFNFWTGDCLHESRRETIKQKSNMPPPPLTLSSFSLVHASQWQFSCVFFYILWECAFISNLNSGVFFFFLTTNNSAFTLSPSDLAFTLNFRNHSPAQESTGFHGNYLNLFPSPGAWGENVDTGIGDPETGPTWGSREEAWAWDFSQ